MCLDRAALCICAEARVKDIKTAGSKGLMAKGACYPRAVNIDSMPNITSQG